MIGLFRTTLKRPQSLGLGGLLEGLQQRNSLVSRLAIEQLRNNRMNGWCEQVLGPGFCCWL